MQVLSLCRSYNLPTNIGDEICRSGADGQVFKLIDEPNKVIKLCALYDSYAKYEQIRNTIAFCIQQYPGEYVRVYEQNYLGVERDFVLFYYVMERLNKISEDEEKLFHSIISHEDRHIIKDYSSAKLDVMLKNMAKGLDFDAGRVRFFYENIRQSSIIQTDLHPRNIMKDDVGNFKLIDLDRCKLKGEIKWQS